LAANIVSIFYFYLLFRNSSQTPWVFLLFIREAALIKGAYHHTLALKETIIRYFYIGLEKYQQEAIGPEGTRNKSGRFPMRNRFVSDYIYKTTGKSRTPKQVGSRLQQLRVKCKENKSKHLIWE
jgi:hypothetical protein